MKQETVCLSMICTGAGILMRAKGRRPKEFLLTRPIIGAWVHGAFAAVRMKRAIVSDPDSKSAPAAIVAQKAGLKRRGYLRSVL